MANKKLTVKTGKYTSRPKTMKERMRDYRKTTKKSRRSKK